MGLYGTSEKKVLAIWIIKGLPFLILSASIYYGTQSEKGMSLSCRWEKEKKGLRLRIELLFIHMAVGLCLNNQIRPFIQVCIQCTSSSSISNFEEELRLRTQKKGNERETERCAKRDCQKPQVFFFFFFHYIN